MKPQLRSPHPILEAVGNFVRRQRDRLIVRYRPPNCQKPTPAQRTARGRMISAQLYAAAAVADRLRRAAYDRLIGAPGGSVHQAAVRDFLSRPQIREIDASGYLGGRGDVVRVVAVDDTVVTRVWVTLRTKLGRRIERGLCRATGTDWEYIARKEMPLGRTVIVQATAADLAGNTVTERIKLRIGT